ncbi:hypothetical protein J6590_034716 [Homalodisca vitripennis]|nr:hypothetical protein J6590_034716 [Homalodisca vitripennis]
MQYTDAAEVVRTEENDPVSRRSAVAVSRCSIRMLRKWLGQRKTIRYHGGALCQCQDAAYGEKRTNIIEERCSGDKMQRSGAMKLVRAKKNAPASRRSAAAVSRCSIRVLRAARLYVCGARVAGADNNGPVWSPPGI